MSDGPAVILVNAAGDIVGIVDIGGTKYLQTEVKRLVDALPAGTNILGLIGIDPANKGGLAEQATLATRASEATLATRASEATLAAIRDTAGVKKITDPLPAGTNEIGKVAQGTKAAGAEGWPQVLYDASGNAVGVMEDGSIRRLQTEDRATAIALDDLVFVDDYRAGLTETGYSLAIDLDNPAGTYKHALTGGLELFSVGATMVKSSVGASWRVVVGVILTIDGTEAFIAWMEFGSLHAEDTSTNVVTKSRGDFPVALDLKVVAGALPKVAPGFTETITAVNTGITLIDINGDPRTPAVGDLISRVELVSGGGTLDIHASISYRGVA